MTTTSGLPRARAFALSLPVLTVLGLCVGLGATIARAGDVRYPAKDIAPGFRGDAHAVVREDAVVFDVLDRRRARETHTIAVTVFDPHGRWFGDLSLPYDRFHRIRSLEGWIYDDQGERVRELEDADQHDVSAISDFSLYEDSREKTAELYYDRYPYTVLYTYVEDCDGYLNWPHWAAQWGKEPVERSSFEVRVPWDMNLRYWTNRDSVKPAITVEDRKRIFRWSAGNLAGLDPDAADEDIDQRTINVLTAPAEFQIDDYAGSMSSWKEFGAWNASLWAGRDRLPDPAVKDVQALVRPGDTKRDIIAKLYAYMQSRTRYVSVQLGIGGWQPFDAVYVHEKGYGDCKALSNYMVALLKQAGVTAYPVLIHSGHRGSLYRRDFPSQQFNHVIVCVPLDKDSLWLECTSQVTPPGHLGWETEDRFALMITPAGGEVVQTPKSSPGKNVQVRTGVVSLSAAGAAQAVFETRYTGDHCDDIREELVATPSGEREKWLLNHIQVQNVTLRGSSIRGLEGRDSSVVISVAMSIPEYGSVTGTRCFFEPNIMERETGLPPGRASRRSPLRFGFPSRDIDSIVYRIPRLYACEALPKEQRLEAAVGSFRSRTVQRDDSTLVFTRVLEIRGTDFPPQAYAEYRKFMSDIVVADRAQVALVRKKP